MENNPCGLALLRIVSRGNAIIAEILRLKDYIPPAYRLNSKQDLQKYGQIILDFSYFNNSVEVEKKIETNPVLKDLNEELKENNLETINQFYFLFENVYKYIRDLNEYLDEVEEGSYIQHTIETMFLTIEGKQLLCESLYLYGVILLFIDIYIEGIIRERLLVAYHRYNAQDYNSENPIDDICKLLRCTKQNSVKSISSYPENYFKRVPVNKNLINLSIGRLRSDDIYNQLSSYPNPDHRSIALAGQAAMLFVCLFFKPKTLHEEFAIMREIVDKFFPDNWVVNVYMGVTLNIIDSWEAFKAAKTAVNNTIQTAEISRLASSRSVNLQKIIIEIKKILGNPNIEKKILDNINSVMNLCRSCNVLLRWYLLHTSTNHLLSENTKRSKQICDQIYNQSLYNDGLIFDLLITTADFELKIKDTFKSLLDEKEARWLKRKDDCVERMNELSEIFSGLTTMSRVKKNENLQIWFINIGKQIEKISMEDEFVTSRKITQIIKALDEVQEFHQLANNYQVSQTIKDTHTYLREMMKTISVKDNVLIDLQIIGDFSYAWYHIDRFTGLMQNTIKEEPSFVIKLRATFLKLVSCMEVPLIRINQSGSENLMSVSKYYSHELIEYIRKVLHIIPETMFKYMTKIATLQTDIIKEIPTRLEKDKLNDYAQLDERLEVAKLTNAVSVLTEGVLCMKSTLVGVVEIDPKQLLEDGIRKELVQHIAVALHNGLIFNPKAKTSELLPKLNSLGNTMAGYRRSFEYIQDYIGIYGLKIWQEELSRIIGYNVEMECNSFMRAKILDWQSVYQSKVIPVPSFEPCDGQSMTFIGRLARELIRITDPKVAVYKEQTTAWYDYKTNEEIINIRFYSNIINSINVCGLTGLDKLIGFMIVSELKTLLDYLQTNIIKDREWLQILGTITKELVSNGSIISNPVKTYQKHCSKFQKIQPTILDSIMRIGQLQIIRKQIFFELEVSCKLNARNLFDCLEAMNKAVLNEVKAHFRDPENKPYPADDNPLLPELSKMLDWAGIGNPYLKIYITTNTTQYISLIAFLFTISQFSKLQYTENLALLMWKKIGDPVDGAPLYIGVQTFLKQFHPDITTQYLEYLAQYIKSIINHCTKSIEKLEIPNEYYVTQFYVERFIFVGELNQQLFLEMVPHFLTDTLEHLKNLSIK
ncbi:WASH complex subunit 5 [Acyrthosiphon pisum]|uniref:WASH complex subunit strumpellin n=1 Tax=Acyrthosiphon pisum TaxID=7029 RepID=A0A8R1W6K4_ACYPI|nr:WASH complex subunit 5 [Acyrthosiphon pisum]|eukprot:XP_001948165.2 PREDICTED: WASH complex subunit strumpellin [Acyrthosiphon pisum]